MSSKTRSPILGMLMLGVMGFTAGCAQPTQVEFAARNATSDFDLHSLVRAQSNELLDMAVDLETSAKRDFPAPKRLNRALSEAVVHSDQMALNLPSLLAAQDVELAEMRAQVLEGTLSKDELSARERAIQTYRKGLIGSLDASAKRTAFTAQQLQTSTRPNLGNQAQIAQDLARDLQNARTMIAMQL